MITVEQADNVIEATLAFVKAAEELEALVDEMEGDGHAVGDDEKCEAVEKFIETKRAYDSVITMKGVIGPGQIGA